MAGGIRCRRLQSLPVRLTLRLSTVILRGFASGTSHQNNPSRICDDDRVRKPPSWPRSWANFSLLSLYSHRNAWVNLHLLGQPDTFRAQSQTDGTESSWNGAKPSLTRTERSSSRAQGSRPCGTDRPT